MKILFLEDEPTIREVLTEYIKMHDYRVRPVDNGDDALVLLKKYLVCFPLNCLDGNF